ncbi:ethanolamine ammonia-lyase reactivating factor EutA [Caulobacter sp. S45]|uniref:ethanolamine ammonia-lyase reactivating factor EutA n=1 Tax=Caulobacter sp. S45 TaxID=1641861 RepID=UPI00131AEAC0|nr:ethanolamine ammonia-lyase reactivating factor EutA [Caulobacter sp. S45]
MDDAPPRPSVHQITDHAYGLELDHSHLGGEADHDHDQFPDQALEDNPIWIADHVTLLSVGVDIGSSGAQVIFSRIHMRRPGEDLSSRYVVVSREAVYMSPVTLTPFESDLRINEAALGAIIDDAFAGAGLTPEQVDTGAVILTGEALRRENAEAISKILADHAGDFVCATAGHHMEATLAAYGSGAARASADQGLPILNVDIGGGTTKLALTEGGKVLATAALHIGGRLLAVDETGRLVRLDPGGARLARRSGFSWALGDVISPDDMDRLADSMADTLVAALRAPWAENAASDLFLTALLPEGGRYEGLMFSGGVAEYVYRRETRDFGDMGRRLGEAIRWRLDAGALAWPLLEAQEGIRATAIGASEYSVQLSGNTIFVSDRGALLPRHNLQVLRPDVVLDGEIDSEIVAQAVARRFESFDLIEGEQDVALAFHWRGDPVYRRIRAFLSGVARALPKTLASGRPLYLVLDADLGRTFGSVLREDIGLANEVLVIDGVALWDFDYIDIGKVRLPSNTVPVTVKSLVFNGGPESSAEAAHAKAHAHGHHHPHSHSHPHPS